MSIRTGLIDRLGSSDCLINEPVEMLHADPARGAAPELAKHRAGSDDAQTIRPLNARYGFADLEGSENVAMADNHLNRPSILPLLAGRNDLIEQQHGHKSDQYDKQRRRCQLP